MDTVHVQISHSISTCRAFCNLNRHFYHHVIVGIGTFVTGCEL
jgi:hypothetical protein